MKKGTLQNRYIQSIGIAVILLALLRCFFPQIAGENALTADNESDHVVEEFTDESAEDAVANRNVAKHMTYLQDGEKPHRLYPLNDYREEFPDSNDLQLTAANQWGVSPVACRQDAEQRRAQLVYIGASPYYHVDPLTASIPYLVPRAAILLQDMGRAFFDSLQVKRLPLHRLIVTSVLRTEEDVAKLRRINKNATERSCHLYGTTFDVTYTRFEPVSGPDGARFGFASEGQLKAVLAEVLRDMRQHNRCYIKYEVKQACFHMTVR